MASTNTASFFSALKNRRTHYALTNKSPISNAQIEEIVKDTLLNVPSAFNSQSTRAVILYGDNHRKLWQLGAKHMKSVLPDQVWPMFEPKIKGLEAAYGTVMFFEDQETLENLGNKNPAVKSEVPSWSEHSAGMHHLALWTAFSLEGLGANLQHYHMVPPFAQEVTETWSLPATWKLSGQLVFGEPSAPPGEKSHLPIEDRLKVIA